MSISCHSTSVQGNILIENISALGLNNIVETISSVTRLLYCVSVRLQVDLALKLWDIGDLGLNGGDINHSSEELYELCQLDSNIH